jgi:isopentenyldiphosphate isomerase
MVKDESPGLWDSSAAGHLESGENYFGCARRELKEELSLSSIDLTEIMIIPAQVQTFWEHVRVYKCVTDKKICIDKNEISEGRYIDVSKIKYFIQSNPSLFTSTFNYIFANYICEQR